MTKLYKQNVGIGLNWVLLFVALLWCTELTAADLQSRFKPQQLGDYLTRVEQAFKVSFVYDPSEIKKTTTLDVPEKLGSIQSSLAPLKQHNIAYRFVGKQIVLNQQLAPKIEKKVITVRGTVKDKKTGGGLPSVSIIVKGTNTAVASDGNGSYQIVVPNANAVLVFRSLGYKTVEATVGDRTRIDMLLEEDASTLNEVTVSTGYQNVERKLFTGSVATLKASDVQRSGIPDVSRMLEGQVAGVSVQNVSGTFGAAPKIRVRGATSLSGDNKPLWVVDGIILEDVVNISNEALSTGDASTLLGSSVAGLNPDDIATFTILKDAAATAMYGARAMNGVIVVTTKRGANTDGKANINYSGTFTTYLKPSYNQFDIMNSAEQMSVLMELENKGYFNHADASRSATGGIFTKMYNEMYIYNEANDSFALKNTPQDRLNFLGRYASANTDWFDVLFKNSLLQEHSLSSTFGSNKSQSYFSTSYTSDNGQTIGDKVKRFTGNLRQNIKFNDRLSFEFLLNGSIRDQRAPGTLTRQSDPVYGQYSRDFDINPYSYALNTSRLITPYLENGNYEYFTRNYAPFNILNELETNYLNLRMLDLKVQGGLKYQLMPNKLTYSVDGAYRYGSSERNHSVLENANMAMAFRANGDAIINENNVFLYNDPDEPTLPAFVVLPEGGFYNTTIDKIKNYYMRHNLEYNETFNQKHRLNLFGSMEVRYTDRENSSYDGVGYQFANGGLVNTNYRYFKKASEGGDAYFGMFTTKERNAAFASRAAYNYDERYSVNATFRYDGSNRMGASAQVRWLPTWNVSGAWDIDQEDFFPRNKVLSIARIRGTYGLVANTGNASNSAVLYFNQITRRPYENEKETAIDISSLANSELTWEKLYETNIGTDLRFFGKVDVTMDYYRRNIFDLLGNFRTAGVGGQSIKFANYGKMSAQGFEFTIGGNPINSSKGFKWRTNLNFAHNTNKVTALEVNPSTWSLIRAEGAPLLGKSQRGLYSIQFDGLNPQFGYPTFVGLDGTRNEPYLYFQNTTDVGNLKYHGPVDPTLTGGFYNQFSYKGFSVSALFTFATGNYVRLQPTYSSRFSDLASMSKEVANRWLFPGDELRTNIPSLLDPYTTGNLIYRPNGEDVDARYTYNAFNYSDQRVAKGDFVRFKNITFTYQVPQKLSSKLKMTNAQISFVGNNVALLYADKKLNGADPEFFNNGGVAMPVPRQYTISIKAGF